MADIKIYKVDAFTKELFSGNPAAVCPLENWLPGKVMQSIAMENKLSETAFYIKNKDKFYIRWFTPKLEIGLCGHATLATAHIIFTETGYKDKEIKFETKSGEILYVSRENNIINMDFPALKPKIVTNQDIEKIHSALGNRPTYFLSNNYGLAVFENEKEIIKMKPDFSKLEKLQYDGIIVSALGKNVDFVVRFFGPKLGIPEDPVTGSAYCELIPYWSERLNKKKLIAKQLSKRAVNYIVSIEERG